MPRKEVNDLIRKANQIIAQRIRAQNMSEQQKKSKCREWT